MAKKKRKKTAEDLAFDERTRMIEDYIARLSKRIEEKKAGGATKP